MSNNPKYIPFERRDNESREDFEKRRAEWKIRQLKALREDTGESERLASPEASLDRQNRGLARQLFGWLLGSNSQQDVSVDDESSPATQEELNGIRAITGSSKQNNLDDAKKKVGECHLNDEGYMVQGKSDRQPFTDNDSWYLDNDGIMKHQ